MAVQVVPEVELIFGTLEPEAAEVALAGLAEMAEMAEMDLLETTKGRAELRVLDHRQVRLEPGVVILAARRAAHLVCREAVAVVQSKHFLVRLGDLELGAKSEFPSFNRPRQER